MDKPYLRIFGTSPGLACGRSWRSCRSWSGAATPASGRRAAETTSPCCSPSSIAPSASQVGTGIAHIYLRHPQLMGAGGLADRRTASRAAAARTRRLARADAPRRSGSMSGGPLPTRVSTSRRCARTRWAAAFPRLVLATLRRRMTALAGEIAGGRALGERPPITHGDLTRRGSRPNGLEDFFVGTFIVTAVDDNRAPALAAARQGLRFYFELPYYQAYFEEAGYHDEVAAARAAIAGRGPRRRGSPRSPSASSPTAASLARPPRCGSRRRPGPNEGVTLVLAPSPVDDRDERRAGARGRSSSAPRTARRRGDGDGEAVPEDLGRGRHARGETRARAGGRAARLPRRLVPEPGRQHRVPARRPRAHRTHQRRHGYRAHLSAASAPDGAGRAR